MNKHDEKKVLSLPQILNMNIGTLGVLFAWELEIANVSGIFSFLGANVNNLGYLWLGPSIIGLLIPLIVGYWSDRTITVYGKRLPYIFWGAILTAICMFWLPSSLSITLAVILLCIFTAAINAAFQPFKPLVADVVTERQHTKVYAIQAALIGIGATASSVTPWLLLTVFSPVTHGPGVPVEIKYSFYVGAIIIFITCLWTTVLTKRYLPIKEMHHHSHPPCRPCFKFRQFFRLFSAIPKTMWQVSLVQFFTWIGVFCFIVYLTPAIEQAIYQVPMSIQQSSHVVFKNSLEKSVVLNGLCCATYMMVNVIYAYVIPFLSKITSRKTVHIFSLFVGGLSLFSFAFIHQISYLLISMIGIGIAWASFNSIPFAMVASSLPEERLGIYMGIFNTAICLPQIIVSLSVGLILKFFLHGNAVELILLSGVSMLIASFLAFFVKDKAIHEMV